MRSPRVEFSLVVKTKILTRAAGHCEACGEAIPEADGEIDHIVAEWTRSATAKGDRAKLTEDDGWLLCQGCHTRKSKREAFERKRTDGAAKRHAGKQKQGRGFRGWRNFKGDIIWRR